MTVALSPTRSYGRTQRSSGRWKRTTLPLLLVAIATFGPVATILFPSGELPEATRLRASILWLLCLLPTWIYLCTPSRSRPPIPFLPLIGVSFALYHVLTAVLGVVNAADLTLQYAGAVQLDPLTDYEKPVDLLLLGWSALLLSYGMMSLARRHRPPETFGVRVPLSVGAMRRWGLRLLWGGLLAEGVRQAFSIPSVVSGLLTFMSSLALFGAALLAILATWRQLSARDRLALQIGFLLLVLVRIGSGSLASVLWALTTVLLAVWAAGGRLTLRWLLVLLVGLSTIVAFRGVAIDYRRQAWHREEELPVSGRSMLMVRLLATKIQTSGVQGALVDGFRAVVGRSANLDLLADVMRQTPAWIPYWGGQTYLSLVGIAVPRVLWPDKPTKVLGQDFGHRYRYLGNEDHATSVNLPFVVEFYANFGELGVIVGMFIVGMIYRLLERLVNNPGQHILTSVCALVLLVPLVNVESDFSLVFGGLLLNGAALWIVLQLIQRSSSHELRPRAQTAQSDPSSVGARALS
jgi:hypothetical protein